MSCYVMVFLGAFDSDTAMRTLGADRRSVDSIFAVVCVKDVYLAHVQFGAGADLLLIAYENGN